MKPQSKVYFLAIALCLLLTPNAQAKRVVYHLTIDYKTIQHNGQSVTALSINNQIPGPTLRFREGDLAYISIHNKMKESTSIHWHGILLPNRQDGVPFVNNPPIEPGETVQFTFPIKQSGTYWFHSHSSLQEQQGIYGSIVITPKEGETLKTDHDQVIVLSDWTNENPEEIMRTLKSGNEYYSYKKNTLQSVWGAMQKGAVSNFLKRSWSRMPAMDLSDVAYERFLANGKPEYTIPAEPGETIRLRLVNAAAATYFYLQFAGDQMKVVAADGIAVKPVQLNRILMAIAETYDVILTVPENGAYEFRATAQDGSGFTSVFIGNGKRKRALDVPKPDYYRMPMSSGSMDHSKMARPKNQGRTPMAQRPMAPYDLLQSPIPTTPSKNRPLRKVVLNLTGDMNRFVWSMNGEIISPENDIRIRHGENIRFIIHNKTMMHHPMHLHGHFFRVINGKGDRAPLKHTIDVPPGGTRIIEFEGDEYKDWFFHCHVLYHAKAGMARVVRYQDKPLDADIEAIRHQLFKDPWFFWINATAQSHMTDGIAVASNTYNIFSVTWETGWQNTLGTDFDIELTYDRYFNRFFTIFSGVNLTDDNEMGFLGLRYLLPFNFWSALRIDHEGDFRITLEQSVQLTPRVELFGDFEYDTETEEEWVAGTNVRLGKNLFLVGQYHSDFGGGGGLRFRF